MLDASLREQMNRKRQELYQEAERKKMWKEAWRAGILKYLDRLKHNSDINGLLFQCEPETRVVFLRARAKEGIPSTEIGGERLYALAYSLKGLERYSGSIDTPQKRAYHPMEKREALAYVEALAEQQNRKINPADIKREIEAGISKLLKKLCL